MPPLRSLILDAFAVTAVAAALAVTVAGYVRNFPGTPADHAAGIDWIDPVTTGSIEPKAGDGTDGAAAERPDPRPSRPAAGIAYRVWTDPPPHPASAGGMVRDGRAETTYRR